VTITLARGPAAVDACRAEAAHCLHCGLPAPSGRRFCCPGCAAAFEAIHTLGLGQYYRQRVLDPAARPPRPEGGDRQDLGRHVTSNADGTCALTLAVEGLQCGACVWLIEEVLGREPDVVKGRLNMTTRRLALVWRGVPAEVERLVARVEALGYRLVPFDARRVARADDATGRALLRALAVAGFAAGNVMLISIGIWAGLGETMGPATRSLMHWVSALIAMPAVAYAGMPFFRSAAGALRHGRTNMDVPISIGVILVTAISLSETINGGPHAYFDSATTLLFFLLIGRVLDHRARGQARATAAELLALRAADVAVVRADGGIERRPQEHVAAGDLVLVGQGERVGVDGVVERGESSLDASLVTGESMPARVEAGSEVFAGTLNLGPALTVRARAAGGGTLLAECVRLIEAAETRRDRYVALADRVARHYAPTVHVLAAATFLFWYFAAGASAATSLLVAASVLIITCPCALALAVPAVQVIAAGRLFREGILLKSPTALERLADVDTVLFDKTGTLTEPMLGVDAEGIDAAALALAASIAASSRHPLARSLVAVAGGRIVPAEGVREYPGCGLALLTAGGEVRLGSRAFCGVAAGDEAQFDEPRTPELWLHQPAQSPVVFRFTEHLRADAMATVVRLRRLGLDVMLASGDHEAAVARVAEVAGIEWARADMSPVDKVAMIEGLRRAGRNVLMVGDGLNDGPALAAALVSLSPATAADISQTVADAVFQGAKLAPVARVLWRARLARRVMRQNFALALMYNILMVPLAIAGLVTPWLAAAAMSGSSLLVMTSSFRAGRADREP